MTHIQVINQTIDLLKAKSYLQIGGFDSTFKAVKAAKKDRSKNNVKEGYDVIFIDGKHDYDTVMIQLSDAMDMLNDGGAAILHDCVPANQKYTHKDLCGDVYKVLMSISDYMCYWLDTSDHGTAVISKQEFDGQETDKGFDYFYEEFLGNIDIDDSIYNYLESEKSEIANQEKEIEEIIEDDKENGVIDSYDMLSEQELRDIYFKRTGSYVSGRAKKTTIIKKLKALDEA